MKVVVVVEVVDVVVVELEVEEVVMLHPHLDGLPGLGEAEALHVAVRRDALRLHRRFHLLNLHRASENQKKYN